MVLFRSGLATWLLVGIVVSSSSGHLGPGTHRAAVVAYVLLAAVRALTLSVRARSIKAPSLVVVGFLAWMAFNFASSSSPLASNATLVACAYVVLAVLGAACSHLSPAFSFGTFDYLLSLIIVATVFQAGVRANDASLSSAGLTFRDGGLFATAGGPNIAGVFCAMVLVCCSAALFSTVTRSGGVRIALVLLAAAAFLSLVLTLSRRAWLAALLVIALQLLLRRSSTAALKFVAAAAVSTGMLFYALFPFLGTQRVQGRLDTAVAGFEDRAREYAMFVQLDGLDKVAGGGLESATYVLVSPGFGSALIPVHSSYLFVALAGGLLALALFLASVASSLAGLWAAAARGEWSSLAALSLLWVLLSSALAGETLFLGPFGFSLWLLIGFATAEAHANRRRVRDREVGSRA